MTEVTENKSSRGRKKDDETEAHITNIIAEMQAKLEGNFSFLVYEDAQEAHDEFVIAICTELVRDDDEGLANLNAKKLDRIEEAVEVYSLLVSSKRNDTVASLLHTSRLVFSDEAQVALEDLHKAIAWEMVSNKGGLQKLSGQDLRFIKRVATIYSRLRQ